MKYLRLIFDICRFAYRYWRLSVSVGRTWGASKDRDTNDAMIAAHRPKEYAELQEIKRRWTKSAT